MATTPYAVRADLVERFTDLEIIGLEDLGNTGAPDPDVSEGALLDATEEINSYIGVILALPLPVSVVIPQPLVRACCDVARFRMYKDRPTEEVKYRYERTIAWLKDLVANKAVLIFDPPLTEVQKDELKGPAVPVGTTYKDGVFGSTNLDKIPGF